MYKRQSLLLFFSLLTILSLVLAGCQPAPAPEPERIVETVIVTEIVEGKPVEIVVTPTPGPEEPEETGGHVILPADGLGPCLPFPEGMPIEAGSAGEAHMAKVDAPRQNANPALPIPRDVAQQAEKVYRVGVFEDITTLNFWAANGPDNTVWNAYMLPQRLSLFTLSEVYFTVVPILAAVNTPPPLVEEGEFWVTEVPMRQDVTWSDGEPLTANDVAFTANAVLKLGLISGNWMQWFDPNFLDHAEAIDDYTVKLYYKVRPGMARHEFGTLGAPILAEHYWAPIVEEALAPVNALPADASAEELAAAQAEAQDKLFAHSPEGEPTAGSYLLNKWEAGAFLESVANSDYFLSGVEIEQFANASYRNSDGVVVGEPEGDPTLKIQIGPFAAAVVYTIYGSQDAAVLGLKNGEVDFVLNSLGFQRGLAEQIRGDPNLAVIENSVNGFRYLSFNNRRRPMNDCPFRQAVAVLIDKDFVTKTVLQNAAFPLYTFVAEGNKSWYYSDVPKLGKGLNREQRLQLAIAILEQAGYTWEGGVKPTYNADDKMVVPGSRLIMPDGTPVPELDLWAPSAGYDPLRSTFAIWIESWLNEFGIPVKAHLAGFNTLIPRIFTEQDFDMYILGWSLDIFPAFLRDFFSEEQAAQDGNNAGGYINEQFETLSQELLTCADLETCKPISDELQSFLAVEQPYVVLFDTGIIEAYRSASVEYPFTQQLSGLQFTHQEGILQAEVKIK